MVTGSTFRFIGGTLCLDFVNTVGGRTGSNRVVRDKLADFKDLVRWGEFAGVLSRAEARAMVRRGAGQPRESEAVFGRGMVLREAMYRICRSPAAADVAVLNRELALAQRHERLGF